jgi:hypothetical protein
VKKFVLPTLDLTTLSSAEVDVEIKRQLSQLRYSLDQRSELGMVRALWIDAPQQRAFLLLVVHHFAVDGVSWRIVLEDLNTLAQTPEQQLPAPTMSLRAWGDHLAKQGESGARRN